MPKALGVLPQWTERTLWTVAQSTDSAKRIIAALFTCCVITHDSLSGVLTQATRLTIAVTVLIIVSAITLGTKVSGTGAAES